MRRTVENSEIAERLDSFALLLELVGSNRYTARAYRRAAETIRATPMPVEELVREGVVQEVRGIGPGIAGRLEELVQTGDIAELRELEQNVSVELVGLGRLLGIAPQRMLDIARTLGVGDLVEFRKAAAAGRLREVPGIGPKTEARILERLDAPVHRDRRGLTLNRARALVEAVAAELGGTPAGDPRRWADVSHDLSVVVGAERPEDVLRRFAGLETIVAVVEEEARRAVGLTAEGVPIEVVIAESSKFGTELLRATGTDDYVSALEPLPWAADEAGVYEALGLPWCPPELREEAFRGEPPLLVEMADVRGDLHCHTTWSDGKASVLEMASHARDLGYEYLAICDHTPNVRVVPGLDADDLRRQGEEIAHANEQLAPFRILRGAEVDIRRDGSLDLPDDILAELDWVQLSLHAGQREAREPLTRKVVEAMRHPAVSCLSHPRGRIINHRPPNALDLDAVLEAAIETGVALETNGLPDRLDLSAPEVRLAVQAGVRIVASTDAHSLHGLGNMRLAIATARRGWASADSVLNTRPVEEILRR